MGSISNKSFASRLGNAKKLKTLLANFATYQAPVSSASIENLANTISTIETLQTTLNNAKTAYTTNIDTRKKLFTSNVDALVKRLSPIRTFIEALKGKNSIELKQVNDLVKKIRGSGTSKSTTSTNEETQQISQIERTYASRLANFKNIIDILISFDSDYSPPNTLITVNALQELSTKASTAMTKVNEALAAYKPLIVKRQEAFSNLKKQVQSIKNFVKAQYGLNSVEYNQIKSLTI